MNTDMPAWRKSTFSNNGGSDCVEVAPISIGVLIRHSKRPADGTIEFTPAQWESFLAAAVSGQQYDSSAAAISYSSNEIRVTSPTTAVTLRYTPSEWAAFTAGVTQGEFAFTNA
jgi:hypothetical protein